MNRSRATELLRWGLAEPVRTALFGQTRPSRHRVGTERQRWTCGECGERRHDTPATELLHTGGDETMYLWFCADCVHEDSEEVHR